MVKTFYCKTNIMNGDAATALQSLNIKSLLLVTDPFFLENGTARRLAAESKAAKTRIFSDVIPDPTVELAAKGTAVVKEFCPDTIVALGGGSAMDCAKAMAYFYAEPVRLVAIPTTSGSGSEVTDFAVLTHGNTKHPLVDGKICPDVAILDEKLLTELPKSLIADAGFDVLCHALEGYVATGAGGITDALAKEAFCVTFAHLPASYGGNKAVRGTIHMAATMAGMAFSQAGLGLCHAMAHSLGGLFHVCHSDAFGDWVQRPYCYAQICQDRPGGGTQRRSGFGGGAESPKRPCPAAQGTPSAGKLAAGGYQSPDFAAAIKGDRKGGFGRPLLSNQSLAG